MVPEIKGARETELFVILGHSLPFHPTDNPENQNFEKLKKLTEDTIILQFFTLNGNHMMHGS